MPDKETESMTKTGNQGTVLYMAPEVVAKGRKRIPYDPFRADMWSLGVTIYQTVTGKAPFEGTTKSEY